MRRQMTSSNSSHSKYRKALRKLNEAMDEFKQTELEYALLVYDDTRGDLQSFLAVIRATQQEVPGRVNYSGKKAEEDLFHRAKQHRSTH